jgi:hypothetical protein
VPFRLNWHQDGRQQNRESDTTQRPRLSVKLAYWLSDVSQSGRGYLKLVPGSHLVNRIDSRTSPVRRVRSALNGAQRDTQLLVVRAELGQCLLQATAGQRLLVLAG